MENDAECKAKGNRLCAPVQCEESIHSIGVNSSLLGDGEPGELDFE